MSGIEGNYGATSSASGSGLDDKALVAGMDTLRKSIEALDKSIAPDSTHGKPDGSADEALLPALDTSLLEAMNSAVRDTTLSMTDFRDKLGQLLSADGEGTVAEAGAGSDLLGGLFGSSEDGAVDEFGEEKKTPEEEIAQVQETAEAITAIEDNKVAKKKEAGAKEKADKKKKLEGIMGDSMKAAKALGLSEKSSAIASTIVNTAQAIGESNPNIAQMAMAAAVGASQLGVIKGQFHGGIDEVPNSGTYLLEKGERVVDKRLNADLKGYMGKSGGNSNNTTSVNSPVTLNFAGEPSPDAVYENRMAIEGILRDIYDEYAIQNPFR